MIKLNWIIIFSIIILLVFLYINNTEHFGATDTINPEAVRNISSVYNTDNLKATNITATDNLKATNITVTGNLNTDNLTATNITGTGNLNTTGANTFKNGISVTTDDPGVLIEKKYGDDKSNRYGIGQFPGGKIRVYTASAYAPAQVILSIAKADGLFEDKLVVTKDEVIINGNLKVNGKIFANDGVRIPYEKQLQFGRSGDNWLTTLGTRSGRVDLDMWRTAEDGIIRDGTTFLGRW